MAEPLRTCLLVFHPAVSVLHLRAQGAQRECGRSRGVDRQPFSMRPQVLPGPQPPIHHRVNIGGVLALFAPYALISDAGALSTQRNGRGHHDAKSLRVYFNRDSLGEGLFEKLSQSPLP